MVKRKSSLPPSSSTTVQPMDAKKPPIASHRTRSHTATGYAVLSSAAAPPTRHRFLVKLPQPPTKRANRPPSDNLPRRLKRRAADSVIEQPPSDATCIQEDAAASSEPAPPSPPPIDPKSQEESATEIVGDEENMDTDDETAIDKPESIPKTIHREEGKKDDNMQPEESPDHANQETPRATGDDRKKAPLDTERQQDAPHDHVSDHEDATDEVTEQAEPEDSPKDPDTTTGQEEGSNTDDDVSR